MTTVILNKPLCWYNRVEGLCTFWIFEIGHIAKKSAIFAEHWAHVRQSFQIQKITGALKINILV